MRELSVPRSWRPAAPRRHPLPRFGMFRRFRGVKRVSRACLHHGKIMKRRLMTNTYDFTESDFLKLKAAIQQRRTSTYLVEKLD